MNLTFGLVSRWFDDVAAEVARLIRYAQRARKLQLTERSDGLFDVAVRRDGTLSRLDLPPLDFATDPFAGPVAARMRTLLRRSRVHVSLEPSRFVFRPLELPRAATPFLEGVVRSQIDRLTPWTASDALFGWSAPADAGADKVRLTVAATARSEVSPIEEALVAAQAHSIEMTTCTEEDRSCVIPMLAGQAAAGGDARGLRLGLVLGLGAFGLVFACCLLAWVFVGGAYESRLAEIEGQLAEQRARLLGQQGSAGDQALQALKKRKRATPSPVIVLEALSKTLPDDTYLSEMRIENGKLQIAGLAGDASQLIHLLEQSPQFAHAAFFAPTVKGPNGAESFHIEAQLQPSFEVAN